VSSGSHIRTIVVLKFFIRVQEERIRVYEELVYIEEFLQLPRVRFYFILLKNKKTVLFIFCIRFWHSSLYVYFVYASDLGSSLYTSFSLTLWRNYWSRKDRTNKWWIKVLILFQVLILLISI